MRSSSIIEDQIEEGENGKNRKRSSVIEQCREQSSLIEEV